MICLGVSRAPTNQYRNTYLGIIRMPGSLSKVHIKPPQGDREEGRLNRAEERTDEADEPTVYGHPKRIYFSAPV